MTPLVDWFTLVSAAARTVVTSRYPQNWNRLKFLVLFAFLWPIIRVVTGLALALDHVLYPDFKDVEIKRPLFIVGNLRTGSTLMFRTLAKDDESIAYFRMVDLFLPAISMKRAVSAVGRLDARLGGYGHRMMQRFDENFLVEYSRMHDTGFLKPEEDDFGLFLHLSSAAMFELFPMVQRFRRFLYVDQEMELTEQAQVMTYYRRLVQRQLYHVGAHKQFVSKNPLFSFKIEALKRTFPDAHFVTLVRTPVSTVVSTASLFHYVWHESGALPPGQLDMETIFDWCEAMYKHPQETLSTLPPERSVVVRYDELVADPGGTIRGVFQRFYLPVAASLESVFVEASTSQRAFKSGHKYSLDRWGVTEADIYARFHDVYQTYGFEKPAAA